VGVDPVEKSFNIVGEKEGGMAFPSLSATPTFVLSPKNSSSFASLETDSPHPSLTFPAILFHHCTAADHSFQRDNCTRRGAMC